MTGSTKTIGIFVDYDNLSMKQKEEGLLDLLTRALIVSPYKIDQHTKFYARIYGGWYEESKMTPKAQDVSVEIQKEFPKLVRIPGKNDSELVPASIHAELATSLLQDPRNDLFSTYHRKGQPTNIRVEKQEAVGCTDENCMLPQLNALLKTGRCPKNGCNFGNRDLIYRHEQKKVDAMLTCDLIYGGNRNYDHIILISGDDDFTPALRTILLNGTSATRIHPKRNRFTTEFPQGGAKFFETDL